MLNFPTILSSQSVGYELPPKQSFETIPFEYINGFIVVDVIFNKTFPLKFILDTGATNTIISKKNIVQIFDMPFGRTFQVYGADLSTVLYAHLVKSVHLATEALVAPSQDILVLEEDYFNFHRVTGLEIHGVLGADMFARFRMKIDFKNKIITLHNEKSKKLKFKGFQSVEMVVQKSKPYIVCQTTLSNETVLDTKLLIDTGASTALMLNTSTDESLVLPPKIIPGNLGLGLGGVIEGYIGRVPYLELGSNMLENVVCRFQEVTPHDSLSLVFRNGIIGNFILDRFTVILDYPNQRLYIKPNKKWTRKFIFDKSGINFISIGLGKKTYYVNSLIEHSPAALAGVESGDIILKVNHKYSAMMSYDKIKKSFQGKTGKTIKLKLKRGKEKIKVDFKLKDLI